MQCGQHHKHHMPADAGTARLPLHWGVGIGVLGKLCMQVAAAVTVHTVIYACVCRALQPRRMIAHVLFTLSVSLPCDSSRPFVSLALVRMTCVSQTHNHNIPNSKCLLNACDLQVTLKNCNLQVLAKVKDCQIACVFYTLHGNEISTRFSEVNAAKRLQHGPPLSLLSHPHCTTPTPTPKEYA